MSFTIKGPKEIDESKIDIVSQEVIDKRDKIFEEERNKYPNDTEETIKGEVAGRIKWSDEVPAGDDWEARQYANLTDQQVRRVVSRFVEAWNGDNHVMLNTSEHPTNPDQKIASADTPKTEAHNLITKANLFGILEKLGISHLESV